MNEADVLLSRLAIEQISVLTPTIDRYFPGTHQVRIYCVINVRRQLPPPEFLRYQSFN